MYVFYLRTFFCEITDAIPGIVMEENFNPS